MSKVKREKSTNRTVITPRIGVIRRLRVKKLLRKSVSLAILMVILLGAIPLVLNHSARASGDPNTLITITPPIQICSVVGKTFLETVSISTSEAVNSLQFVITYNSSLLDIGPVSQGTFFPQQFPPTQFVFENNPTAGTINISMSLVNPQTMTGNGTLATVIFEAIKDPQTLAYSPIRLDNISILNSAHQSIPYTNTGAMYFWKYVTPPPSQSTARVVDLYTQRSGIGQDVYGGEFAAGSVVILSALATYNNFSIQHLPVAFQVLDDQNQTVAILVDMTDENGVATVQFRIPSNIRSEGTWIAVASVDISCTIVVDITSFMVFLPSVIGGYTISTPKRADPTPIYVTILAALAATVAFGRRRPRRRK